MSAKTSVLISILLVMTGAAYGFGEKANPPNDSGEEPSSSSSNLGSSGNSVWVTRPDGAQQCAPGTGQSLDQSANELKKAQIHVLSSQKGSDKKMHAQVCGIPTGKTNMFQIPKEDLGKAVALGFHEVKAP
jgi:hypothetical protein